MEINSISNSLYGLQKAQNNLAGSSKNIASSSVEGSNVNLEREAVSLVENEAYYKANAKVLQTELDTLGSILDLKA